MSTHMDTNENIRAHKKVHARLRCCMLRGINDRLDSVFSGLFLPHVFHVYMNTKRMKIVNDYAMKSTNVAKYSFLVYFDFFSSCQSCDLEIS